MAITPISNLPPVVNLTGNEIFPLVQTGVASRVTLTQINSFLVTPTSNITGVYAEELTVTGTNTLSNLTQTPKGGFYMITVNGATYFSVGTDASFSVSGQTVTWTSLVVTIIIGNIVYAVYTY